MACLAALATILVAPIAGASGRRQATWIISDQTSSGWVSPAVSGVLWYGTTAAPSTRAVPIFTSVSGLRHALATKALGKARLVAYDPEKWSRTPIAEQQRPISAMRAFTALAHGHHLGSIVVPGRDLPLAPGASCTKFRGETLDQAFLACGLTFGAVGATYLVLQVASEESTPTAFLDVLREVGQQLHLASPRTRLMVTLSTSGLKFGPLSALARRASIYASGIELNTTPLGVPEARHVIAAVGS